ncbi:DNA polymerase Y family protein [Nocardioides marinquilinus]|uniref:DNA polymerase Y family protein n=2 Tax=Nocardioides marinquilinus TaxID=1210400 RepID=A0ABP9Q3X1_9ACTN
MLVAWCPDWSVVAALAEADRPASPAAAVLAAGVVEVCNTAARTDGVRRGQRRRDAQSRCPDLVLLEADDDRDARAFEPVLATVEELAPGVAALRPGLLAVRAPGRYFGGDEQAAATLTEALVEAGVWDCRIGVADDLFAAEQAARSVGVQACRVVPPGGSAAFLGPLPVDVLEADGAQGRSTVSLLRRLGLQTLGDLAGLPGAAVAQRFGSYGARVWRSARGADASRFAARQPPPELETEIAFEPPLESVEAVCFSVRTTAERFVAGLAQRQLVATGVRVEAECDGATVSSRTWLHPRFFTSRDLVDRVHWQLQAAGATSGAGSALRSRHASGRIGAPIERVRFVPEAVEPDAAHADGLWGGGGDELVEKGVARVQAMLGFDAVRRPVLQGGRGPAARQALAPWGERAVGLRPLDRPWPGRLPGPAPVRVFATPLPADVLDAGDRPVRITARGAVSGDPCRFRMRAGSVGAVGGAGSAGGVGGALPIPPSWLPWVPVTGWAGPWPADESWWDGGTGLAARFQVVGADGRAWLLECTPDGWQVEAGYD